MVYLHCADGGCLEHEGLMHVVSDDLKLLSLLIHKFLFLLNLPLHLVHLTVPLSFIQHLVLVVLE